MSIGDRGEGGWLGGCTPLPTCLLSLCCSRMVMSEEGSPAGVGGPVGPYATAALLGRARPATALKQPPMSGAAGRAQPRRQHPMQALQWHLPPPGLPRPGIAPGPAVADLAEYQGAGGAALLDARGPQFSPGPLGGGVGLAYGSSTPTRALREALQDLSLATGLRLGTRKHARQREAGRPVESPAAVRTPPPHVSASAEAAARPLGLSPLGRSVVTALEAELEQAAAEQAQRAGGVGGGAGMAEAGSGAGRDEAPVRPQSPAATRQQQERQRQREWELVDMIKQRFRSMEGEGGSQEDEDEGGASDAAAQAASPPLQEPEAGEGGMEEGTSTPRAQRQRSPFGAAALHGVEGQEEEEEDDDDSMEGSPDIRVSPLVARHVNFARASRSLSSPASVGALSRPGLVATAAGAGAAGSPSSHHRRLTVHVPSPAGSPAQLARPPPPQQPQEQEQSAAVLLCTLCGASLDPDTLQRHTAACAPLADVLNQVKKQGTRLCTVDI